jgi:uncharacterized cupin superfamily protein
VEVSAGGVTDIRNSEEVIVVLGILHMAENGVFQIVGTGDCTGFGAGLIESEEQHTGENGDDRDNHQQLDQGEVFFHFLYLSFL